VKSGVGQLLELGLRLGEDDLRLTGEQGVDLRVGVGHEVQPHAVDVGRAVLRTSGLFEPW
jgi:hypothetical protein